MYNKNTLINYFYKYNTEERNSIMFYLRFIITLD